MGLLVAMVMLRSMPVLQEMALAELSDYSGVGGI